MWHFGREGEFFFEEIRSQFGTSSAVIGVSLRRRLGSIRTPQLKPAHPSIRSQMPGFIRANRFVVEMFLCEETYNAFIKGEKVGWYKSEDKKEYRCFVPDPQTFPRRHGADKSDLPFKYIGVTDDDHLCAGEGYARALRKGLIKGNPSYLLQACAPINNFLERLEQGDIVVYAGQSTVAFVHRLTEENYPGFSFYGTEVTNEEGRTSWSRFTRRSLSCVSAGVLKKVEKLKK